MRVKDGDGSNLNLRVSSLRMRVIQTRPAAVIMKIDKVWHQVDQFKQAFKFCESFSIRSWRGRRTLIEAMECLCSCKTSWIGRYSRRCFWCHNIILLVPIRTLRIIFCTSCWTWRGTTTTWWLRNSPFRCISRWTALWRSWVHSPLQSVPCWIGCLLFSFLCSLETEWNVAVILLYGGWESCTRSSLRSDSELLSVSDHSSDSASDTLSSLSDFSSWWIQYINII